MPNTTLVSLERIQQRVRTRLGARGVKVELEQDDILECITSTLEHYNQRRPFKRHFVLAGASPTVKRYVLSPVAHPGLAGIEHVDFVEPISANSPVDPFDPFFTTLGGSAGVGATQTFGELMQRLMYTEDAYRIINAEPEWHAGWELTDYALYVDLVRSGLSAAYKWSGYYSPDFEPGTGMQLIPGGDVEWFIKYATANAKEILGRVRGKFQGITNPDGAQDPVDYTELLQEAQQEKERLEAELDKRRPPLAPVIE